MVLRCAPWHEREIAMQSVNILIVEDEPIAATYLKTLLEKESGVQVFAIVDTADEARIRLEESPINMVFMDVVIRGQIGGDELALEIHRQHPKTLIVFLTAYSDEEILDRAASAHAFGYLLKPYRSNEIRAILRLAKVHLASSLQSPERLELVDGFYYDFKTGRLYHEVELIALTPQENRLIDLLAHNHTITLDTPTLIEQLGITDDALRALIYRIRKETTKGLIRSIKRFGYVLALSKTDANVDL